MTQIPENLELKKKITFYEASSIHMVGGVTWVYLEKLSQMGQTLERAW